VLETLLPGRSRFFRKSSQLFNLMTIALRGMDKTHKAVLFVAHTLCKNTPPGVHELYRDIGLRRFPIARFTGNIQAYIECRVSGGVPISEGQDTQNYDNDSQ